MGRYEIGASYAEFLYKPPSGVLILFQPETLHLHHHRKYRDNAQANYLQERTAHENNKNRPESKQKTHPYPIKARNQMMF